ncbi:hypothetical protein E2C01_079755 [Portunus trituberculatus]|uniref:Uncharacterized protein n=1 Tax=Portunus trituberculatus TaxID=210409 RepID=A0A5B7IU64_PORTR|nr:hypothetical protein [Portunus trituberculatus]
MHPRRMLPPFTRPWWPSHHLTTVCTRAATCQSVEGMTKRLSQV